MSEDKVIKVKPWGQDQGDHVLLNESDFNPDFHVRLDDDSSASAGLKVAELRAALTERGIEIPEGAKKAELQALLDAAQ